MSGESPVPVAALETVTRSCWLGPALSASTLRGATRDVAGAIAVPVLAPSGALVGVGKIQEHTYTDAEQRVLADCAAHIGRALSDA